MIEFHVSVVGLGDLLRNAFGHIGSKIVVSVATESSQKLIMGKRLFGR